mmetsp:Transcript_41690/g.108546  ORF Transcript_41690/g.108546 Transcript_41690/m.108546 type:complete len:266 (+) Transcript_41690:67-864(+)
MQHQAKAITRTFWQTSTSLPAVELSEAEENTSAPAPSRHAAPARSRAARLWPLAPPAGAPSGRPGAGSPCSGRWPQTARQSACASTLETTIPAMSLSVSSTSRSHTSTRASSRPACCVACPLPSRQLSSARDREETISTGEMMARFAAPATSRMGAADPKGAQSCQASPACMAAKPTMWESSIPRPFRSCSILCHSGHTRWTNTSSPSSARATALSPLRRRTTSGSTRAPESPRSGSATAHACASTVHSSRCTRHVAAVVSCSAA